MALESPSAPAGPLFRVSCAAQTRDHCSHFRPMFPRTESWRAQQPLHHHCPFGELLWSCSNPPSSWDPGVLLPSALGSTAMRAEGAESGCHHSVPLRAAFLFMQNMFGLFRCSSAPDAFKCPSLVITRCGHSPVKHKLSLHSQPHCGSIPDQDSANSSPKSPELVLYLDKSSSCSGYSLLPLHCTFTRSAEHMQKYSRKPFKSKLLLKILNCTECATITLSAWKCHIFVWTAQNLMCSE